MLHLLAPLPSGERSRGASRAGEGAVQRSILEAVGMRATKIHIFPAPLSRCALRIQVSSARLSSGMNSQTKVGLNGLRGLHWRHLTSIDR